MAGLLLFTLAAVVANTFAIPPSVASYRASLSLSEEPIDDAMGDFIIQPREQEQAMEPADCVNIRDGGSCQYWASADNQYGLNLCTSGDYVDWMDTYCKKTCNKCERKCQCGVTNTNRIIGGTEVYPERKYPWQVGLSNSSSPIRCGGTIINDRWIITAAHCIFDLTTCKPKYNTSSELKVVVGEHNQFDESDDVTDTKGYSIKTYKPHPYFNCWSLDYDIALLELTEVIPFNSVIRPICLPEDDTKTYVGLTGIVTGWGSIGMGQRPAILREVELPILDSKDCGSWGPLPPMKMCAGGLSDKDSCQGDSGGPMYVVENGKYVQVGVVSYGLECASTEYPGVYVRVSSVLSWIAENTSNGKKCD